MTASRPPIGSYTVTETRWATQCEKCGATIEEGYHSATAAREAWDNLRSLEGAALCDNCWPDPDELGASS